MNSGYVKLYGTILTSSIWLEPDATLRVWIAMLALADKNGEVSGSVGGLAHIANVSRADCETALAVFMAPDPDSRTADNEGRRIEKIEGGWRVLNAEKYRDMRSETQVEWAERKRAWREKNSSGQSEDNEDMSEDKPIALASAVASALELTAVVTARELSASLITRLNQGHLDNPAIGQRANTIPHGHAPSLTAAEEIAQAQVPPEFAADRVYQRALKYKPTARNKQINSLAYLAQGVISDWEKELARNSANGTSRPAMKLTGDKASQSHEAIARWLAEKETETVEAEVIDVE